MGVDRANLGPDVTLSHHIEDVPEALAGVRGKAVLVGHSYAGMVISGAVESSPTKVHALVFLDAFVPEGGNAHWICFHHKSAASFVILPENEVMGGDCTAEKANWISGD